MVVELSSVKLSPANSGIFMRHHKSAHVPYFGDFCKTWINICTLIWTPPPCHCQNYKITPDFICFLDMKSRQYQPPSNQILGHNKKRSISSYKWIIHVWGILPTYNHASANALRTFLFFISGNLGAGISVKSPFSSNRTWLSLTKVYMGAITCMIMPWVQKTKKAVGDDGFFYLISSWLDVLDMFHVAG